MEESKIISSKQRQGRLMFRLFTLVIVAIIVYSLLANYLNIHIDFYIIVGFIIAFLGNLVLVRLGYIDLPKILGLILFNIMLFLVASSEPFSAGMHLQFFTAGAVALVLFGYKQWKASLGFVMLSLILSIITFRTNISFLPLREFTDGQAQIYFILNLLIAASVSFYTILIIFKNNYETEQFLYKHEKIINNQNLQLLKTNAELDRFVYSASHDLRAPLSTLEGLIKLVEQEKDSTTRLKYLQLMKSRVTSMNSFISEIVDYSRNNRLEIKYDSVNLKSLLKDIVADLQYTPGWEEVTIQLDLEDIIIQTDETRLKMVFTNIISNGIKYRNPYYESWIKLKGEIKDNIVIITVEDNGIGIKKEFHPRIFEMFFRAHDHSSGSGLGLYIAKESLLKLSGSITLDSIVEKGSTFTVTLPYKKEELV